MRVQLNKLLLLAVAMSFLFTAEAFARFGKGPGPGDGRGWRSKAQYSRKYDINTIETVTGEIVSFERTTSGKGGGYGIHLMLQTEKELIAVHLGPAWYVENQEAQLQVKDKIEVKGSRVIYDGKPVIIAAQITKGQETLLLRDEDGFPAWRGWRRRRR